MRSVSRLFHAVVVFGAALSACRGEARREPSGGGSQGGAGGAGDAAGGGVAGGGGLEPCAGGVEVPADCAAAADFFCEPCGQQLGQQRCRCDAAAPDDPSACDKTQDYHCQSYSPMTGCSCVAGSPASAADCPGGQLVCGIDEPPIGCDCITATTPK